MATRSERAEEQRKMRYLRTVVDLTAAILHQGNLSLPEALDLVEATKAHVLHYFPDKGAVYDLIYTPRFERIINENIISN